ncbi:MAG: YgcG family protein [Saprospiraceae bacterium]
MRQVLLLLFLISTTLCWSQRAETLAKIPDPLKASNSFVYDPAGRMDAYSRQATNGLLHLLNKETDAQGAVAFLPTIGDDTPKDFAVALFKQWGIGQAGSDEGYLLLIVEDQRRAEIETGYGMESILTDALAKRVLTNEFVPYMKRGERGSAVLATVRAIDLIYRGTKGLDSIPSVAYSEYMDPLVPMFGGHDDLYTDLTPGSSGQPYYNDRLPQSATRTGNWWSRNPILVTYLTINFLFHLLLSCWVLVVYFDKETLHDKWRRIRYWQSILWCFIFPFPYAIVTYPILSRYLLRLRNMPRYAKGSGEIMRRLSRSQEDEFLEHGNTIEEKIGSIDHDVWVTKDRSEVLILPYAKRMSGYTACPSCSYKTYKMTKSKTITRATTSRSGKRELTFSCKACQFQKKEIKVIPRKSNSSSGGGSFSSGGGGGSSFGGGSSGGGGSGASW